LLLETELELAPPLPLAPDCDEDGVSDEDCEAPDIPSEDEGGPATPLGFPEEGVSFLYVRMALT
jgi:hypothetical protein